MWLIRDQCVSQWCCVTCLYLSVAGGGLLLILPPRDSSPDPNVVVSNISRKGFAYQWPVSVYVWVTDGALDVSQGINLKHHFPPVSFSEPSAGMGWGVRGRSSLRGHSAAGACDFRLKLQQHGSMLRFCPVQNLQGAATEGREPGPAGESAPRPLLPGAGLRQDLPVHIQNLHQYLRAHRAALPEVPSHFGHCIVRFIPWYGAVHINQH